MSKASDILRGIADRIDQDSSFDDMDFFAASLVFYSSSGYYFMTPIPSHPVSALVTKILSTTVNSAIVMQDDVIHELAAMHKEMMNSTISDPGKAIDEILKLVTETH